MTLDEKLRRIVEQHGVSLTVRVLANVMAEKSADKVAGGAPLAGKLYGNLAEILLGAMSASFRRLHSSR